MKMPADPIYRRWFRPLLPRPFTSCCSNASAYPYLPSWILPPSGREIAPLMSSRWNPSAEQVQVLEELYRQGTRTPSAAEIQQIVARLRRFGKVESKNVFYWFQNHKARDRQKQRGKHAQIPRRRRSGSSRKYSVIAHPKESAVTSDYTTCSKNNESMHGAMAQEMQHKVCNDEKGPAEENAYYLCKMLPPKYDYFRNYEGSGIRENQTLELFPGRGINGLITVEEESNDGSRLVPNQFFEFLPTKN